MLFDGDCAFCSTVARWMVRTIPTDVPLIPWQHADLDALAVPLDAVQAAVVLTGPTGYLSGAAAIAGLLRSSRSPAWRWVGHGLDLPGLRALAEMVYRWIARNRHRLPGGTTQCALPAG